MCQVSLKTDIFRVACKKGQENGSQRAFLAPIYSFDRKIGFS
jgi:hypothetical protein